MIKSFFKYIPAHLGRIFNLKTFILIYSFTASELFSGSIITGTVTETNGRPVTDVNITLQPSSFGTVSDDKGNFIFQRVPYGRYRIIFEHISFKTGELYVNSTAENEQRIDIVLERNVIEMDPLSVEIGSDFSPTVVLEARQIDRTENRNAEDILKSVPDINIQNTDGTRSRVNIRGTDPKHTSVYLDGVLLNSALDGSFDLRSIPSEIIDTVEIYKAGDLMQTGNSIGGIISIKTKKTGSERETKISYNSGLFLSDRDEFNLEKLNNHSYGISAKYPLGDEAGVFISYSGSRNENEWSYINAAKADEYRYIIHPNVPRTQTNAYSYSDNIFTSCKYSKSGSDYNIGLSYSENRNGLPGWYDQPYYSAYSEKRDFSANGRADLKKGEKFSLGLGSSYNYRNDRVKINEIDELFFADTDDDFNNFNIKADAKYSSGSVIIRAGSEYRSESVSSSSVAGGKRTREIKSLYSKAEYGKKILSGKFDYHASGALRKDFISGTEFDRILFAADNSIVYTVKDLKLIPGYSYSQSYNLPSFSDLFWADNLYSAGNPDLKPEYAEQHEFSLKSTFIFANHDLRAGYTFYDKKLDGLIVWIKRTSGKYTPENYKKGRIKGHEISAAIGIFDNMVSLEAAYSRTYPKQFTDDPVTDGKYVIYKPLEVFSTGINAEYNGCTASFHAKYNGKMYLNETNSIDIYPFWLYDASVSKIFKSAGAELKISAFCDNMSDEQYQVIYGYPMPGKRIGTAIEIKF